MKIFVSIIIPVFNGADYIERAIDSALAQSYSDKEIIVVNDGSTDDTEKTICRYGQKIKIIKQPNLGVSHARNNGISKAKGNYLAFLDADDIWLENKLSQQVKCLQGKHWNYCDAFYIGPNQSGSILRSDLTKPHLGLVFKHLLNNNFITTSSVLVEKSLVLENGGFDTNQNLLEDWKLWLKIALRNPITYLPIPLVKYTVQRGTLSGNARKMLIQHLEIINQMTNKKYGITDISTTYKKSLQECYKICSYVAEENKDYLFAFYCCLKWITFALNNPLPYKRSIKMLLLSLISPFNSK